MCSQKRQGDDAFKMVPPYCFFDRYPPVKAWRLNGMRIAGLTPGGEGLFISSEITNSKK
jgi:hypothetical protein